MNTSVFLLSCLLAFSFQSELNIQEGSGHYEGSGQEIDEAWLTNLLDEFRIPRYLLQRVYQLGVNLKSNVDDEEIITLDMSVPNYAMKKYHEMVLGENRHFTLDQMIANFQKVVFYGFRPFGCQHDDLLPNIYQLDNEKLNCIASNLLLAIYQRSEFSQKYFSRAIHFGLISRAPIEHRVSEMLVYQFLLPPADFEWFVNLKETLRNSFWNELEHSRIEDYEINSFQCGSIDFIKEIQNQIEVYFQEN